MTAFSFLSESFIRSLARLACVAFALLAVTIATNASEIDARLGAPLTKRARPTLGPADAAIIVIEVRSFKCAHCRAFHENVFPVLRDRYIPKGKVQWIAINGTPDANDANGAVFAIARCSAQLGVYAQIEPFLFQNGNRSSSYLYSKISSVPNIDAEQLNASVRSGAALADVKADFAEVAALKVTQLPTFILRKRRPDGSFIETRMEGYPQADQFDAVMKQLEAHP